MKRKPISYHFRKTNQYKRLGFLTLFFKIYATYRYMNVFKDMVNRNTTLDINIVDKFKNEFNAMFNTNKEVNGFMISEEKMIDYTLDAHQEYKKSLEKFCNLLECEKDEMVNCIIGFDNLQCDDPELESYRKLCFTFFHVYLSQYVLYIGGDIDSKELSRKKMNVSGVDFCISDCFTRKICTIAENYLSAYFGL